MRISSIIDTLVFSASCWESATPRIRNIVLSLKTKSPVTYIEPPVTGYTHSASLIESYQAEGIKVLTPHLPQNTKNDERNIIVNELLNKYLNDKNVEVYESWYLGTSAWEYSNELSPYSITLDAESNDDLYHPLASLSSIITSAVELNSENYIHLINGVEIDHFLQARLNLIKPDDLQDIPEPMIGCFGLKSNDVIYELARQRPHYQFILFQDNDLEYPEAANIHFIGKKNFYSLPLYLSPLRLAITVPNEEIIDQLLCAGKKIVQIGKTESITSLVEECNTVDEVLESMDKITQSHAIDPIWLKEADDYLLNKTWDKKIEQVFKRRNEIRQDDFSKNITPQIV